MQIPRLRAIGSGRLLHVSSENEKDGTQCSEECARSLYRFADLSGGLPVGLLRLLSIPTCKYLDYVQLVPVVCSMSAQKTKRMAHSAQRSARGHSTASLTCQEGCQWDFCVCCPFLHANTSTTCNWFRSFAPCQLRKRKGWHTVLRGVRAVTLPLR